MLTELQDFTTIHKLQIVGITLGLKNNIKRNYTLKKKAVYIPRRLNTVCFVNFIVHRHG